MGACCSVDEEPVTEELGRRPSRAGQSTRATNSSGLPSASSSRESQQQKVSNVGSRSSNAEATPPDSGGGRAPTENGGSARAAPPDSQADVPSKRQSTNAAGEQRTTLPTSASKISRPSGGSDQADGGGSRTAASGSHSGSKESDGSLPMVRSQSEDANQLRVFTVQEMAEATGGWQQKLGQGGFGPVFRAIIDEDESGEGTEAAVKVLNTGGHQGDREWTAEVRYLGALRHPHLVRLIGYCAEGEQRLLIYEFMERGSLERYLFRKSIDPLPWNTRMKVALHAASGLAFLHSVEPRPVIYRDFKTSNILVDKEFNAKLSDFGLAKDGPSGSQSHVSTRVMGTHGYAAPEYILTGHLTTKADVYSFGIVLLEMIAGRRAMEKNLPPNDQFIGDWAAPILADRRQTPLLVDRRLGGAFSVKGLRVVSKMAQHCIKPDAKERPPMRDIVQSLEAIQDLTDFTMQAAMAQQ